MHLLFRPLRPLICRRYDAQGTQDSRPLRLEYRLLRPWEQLLRIAGKAQWDSISKVGLPIAPEAKVSPQSPSPTSVSYCVSSFRICSTRAQAPRIAFFVAIGRMCSGWKSTSRPCRLKMSLEEVSVSFVVSGRSTVLCCHAPTQAKAVVLASRSA